MNNLRKIVTKIKIGECICSELECGHMVSFNAEHYDMEHVACHVCANENGGYMTHYYDRTHGNVKISEFDKKCHLCKRIDKLSNLYPTLSSNGKYYYSHTKCIRENNGFATKSDNKNNMKNKHTCTICRKKFDFGYNMGTIHHSVEICDMCHYLMHTVNIKEFKILKCNEKQLFKSEIYNRCRAIVGRWAFEIFVQSLSMKEKSVEYEVHHVNLLFLDILYTSIKLLDVDLNNITDSDFTNVENLVAIIHWFFTFGVAIPKNIHKEYHDFIKLNNIEMDSETLIDFCKKRNLDIKIELEKNILRISNRRERLSNMLFTKI